MTAAQKRMMKKTGINPIKQPEMTVDENGNKIWCLNGKVHRTDGPAIEMADGGKKWIVNHKFHRLDGPAIIDDTGSIYYKNGEIHRIDGPAVEMANGTIQWWVEGQQCTSEEVFAYAYLSKNFLAMATIIKNYGKHINNKDAADALANAIR